MTLRKQHLAWRHVNFLLTEIHQIYTNERFVDLDSTMHLFEWGFKFLKKNNYKLEVFQRTRLAIGRPKCQKSICCRLYCKEGQRVLHVMLSWRRQIWILTIFSRDIVEMCNYLIQTIWNSSSQAAAVLWHSSSIFHTSSSPAWNVQWRSEVVWSAFKTA